MVCTVNGDLVPTLEHERHSLLRREVAAIGICDVGNTGGIDIKRAAQTMRRHNFNEAAVEDGGVVIAEGQRLQTEIREAKIVIHNAAPFGIQMVKIV